MDVSTEKQILSAAKKLFLDKGFAMTSTADIAREAGCNTAMIHYYYRTKDNLFAEVFRAEFAQVAQGVMSIPTSGISFEDRIGSIVGAHFDFFRNNPKIPFFLIQELTTNPTRINDLKEYAIGQLHTILSPIQIAIDEEVEKGRARSINAQDFAMNMAMLNAATFLMLPILENVGIENKEAFLDNRRRVIIETIINSIIIRGNEE